MGLARTLALPVACEVRPDKPENDSGDRLLVIRCVGESQH